MYLEFSLELSVSESLIKSARKQKKPNAKLD